MEASSRWTYVTHWELGRLPSSISTTRRAADVDTPDSCPQWGRAMTLAKHRSPHAHRARKKRKWLVPLATAPYARAAPRMCCSAARCVRAGSSAPRACAGYSARSAADCRTRSREQQSRLSTFFLPRVCTREFRMFCRPAVRGSAPALLFGYFARKFFNILDFLLFSAHSLALSWRLPPLGGNVRMRSYHKRAMTTSSCQ